MHLPKPRVAEIPSNAAHDQGKFHPESMGYCFNLGQHWKSVPNSGHSILVCQIASSNVAYSQICMQIVQIWNILQYIKTSSNPGFARVSPPP